MEKVINRVDRLIATLGMNDNSFSKKANLSVGNLSYVRSKDTDVSRENIRRICEAFPNVNAEWLLFGNGEMFRDGSSSPFFNNNNTNNNTINVGTSTPSNDKIDFTSQQDLIKAILQQQEITLKAQELAKKQQEQSDRLLSIIEHLQNTL